MDGPPPNQAEAGAQSGIWATMVAGNGIKQWAGFLGDPRQQRQPKPQRHTEQLAVAATRPCEGPAPPAASSWITSWLTPSREGAGSQVPALVGLGSGLGRIQETACFAPDDSPPALKAQQTSPECNKSGPEHASLSEQLDAAMQEDLRHRIQQLKLTHQFLERPGASEQDALDASTLLVKIADSEAKLLELEASTSSSPQSVTNESEMQISPGANVASHEDVERWQSLQETQGHSMGCSQTNAETPLPAVSDKYFSGDITIRSVEKRHPQSESVDRGSSDHAGMLEEFSRPRVNPDARTMVEGSIHSVETHSVAVQGIIELEHCGAEPVFDCARSDDGFFNLTSLMTMQLAFQCWIRQTTCRRQIGKVVRRFMIFRESAQRRALKRLGFEVWHRHTSVMIWTHGRLRLAAHRSRIITLRGTLLGWRLARQRGRLRANNVSRTLTRGNIRLLRKIWTSLTAHGLGVQQTESVPLSIGLSAIRSNLEATAVSIEAIKWKRSQIIEGGMAGQQAHDRDAATTPQSLSPASRSAKSDLSVSRASKAYEQKPTSPSYCLAPVTNTSHADDSAGLQLAEVPSHQSASVETQNDAASCKRALFPDMNTQTRSSPDGSCNDCLRAIDPEQRSMHKLSLSVGAGAGREKVQRHCRAPKWQRGQADGGTRQPEKARPVIMEF